MYKKNYISYFKWDCKCSKTREMYYQVPYKLDLPHNA